ncbi:hypothetical protein HF086_009593 [Spodoptera exigua]|uniref:Uncharacterized protein n=1 Tax=Spodoptera exigua TaxID=7107 RepID=A0A922M346_SPOEX|nr:hypothetical protein HF086_009593 [Spodoptera exigua]
MTSTDTYQLKWHSHSSHLNGSVAALLRSERFTDVVLCTLDGSQIPAHKFILSSCSVYLSNLFEGQRSVTRMGGMLYVVLPSEISTIALKILVEYMYKGETTVSNDVLDTVLKAGEVLKIRGLWRQTDDGSSETPEKATTQTITTTSLAKPALAKKPDEISRQPKIAVKKDDKLLKAFNPGQPGARPMFIGPPKLVFIKTSEGGAQAAIRPGGPKGQTILVAPAPTAEPAVAVATATPTATSTPAPTTVTVATTTASEESSDEPLTPRILRRHTERKYGKRQKTEVKSDEDMKDGEETQDSETSNEPEWDASSIEEEERSIAEMFQAEMSVKSEPTDEVDIEEESLWRDCDPKAVCKPWHGRPVVGDADSNVADLLPAGVRAVRGGVHGAGGVELAISNNSAPPKRHNRFTEGAQNKSCTQCKKTFPSHASMLIHMRTHTGERPFVCGLCNKGFNVKSNLLRHLRTLHDQLISPSGVDDAEEEEVTPGPSEVKRES